MYKRQPWHYVDLTTAGDDLDDQIARLCAEERVAVCDLADKPAFRAALIRTAPDQHRFVLSNHHIVLDGWSLPILLGELFASYYGRRLPPPVPFRRYLNWLAGRNVQEAREAWTQVLTGFDAPTLVGSVGRARQGPRTVASFTVPEQATKAIGDLARSCHTTAVSYTHLTLPTTPYV